MGFIPLKKLFVLIQSALHSLKITKECDGNI